MAAAIYLFGFISFGVKWNYGGKKAVCYVCLFRMTFDLNNRSILKFHWIQINLSFVKNFTQWNPDVTILDYNEISGITNVLCPGKSYSKMYDYNPALTIFYLTIFPR